MLCFTVRILGCFYGQLLEQLQCCLTVRLYCLLAVILVVTAYFGLINDDDEKP